MAILAKPRDVSNDYVAFINRVMACGMPVGFLLQVRVAGTKVYWDPLVDKSETEEYLFPFTEQIHFRPEIADYLSSDIDPTRGKGSTREIGTIYHERTHAYLDIKQNDPKVAEIIRNGTAYYKDAPMSDGSTSRDPARLFNEAVATYVQHRIVNWFDRFLLLESTFSATPKDRWASAIATIRGMYVHEAKKRLFGYEERFSNPELETTKPISDDLRNFCDHELLEDKIPDDFDSVPAYQQLLQNMTGAVQFHFVR
jgi:hypothetical protein